MTSLIENAIADKCLLIDSSHQSRLGLLHAIKSIGLVQQVIEAKSLANALTQLQQDNIELCLLGPALRAQTAAKFIAEARSVLKDRSCVFVAITKGGVKSDPLNDAGAHGVLQEPYTKEKLSDYLLSVLREHGAGSPTRAKTADNSTLTIIGGKVPKPQGLSVRLDKSLADVIDDVGFQLNQLAKSIKRGKHLSPDGRPNAVLLDKFRLAIEPLFPDQTAVKTIGSPEHFFASAVVDWFSNRSQMDEHQALRELTNKLIGQS